MGKIRLSLKILEKSEEEIDSLKAAVESLNLSDDEKETLIYGLYLIVWLPKLILEQAISMFRLKELLFGKSTRKSSSNKSKSKPDDNKGNQNNDIEQPNDSSANDEQLDEPFEHGVFLAYKGNTKNETIKTIDNCFIKVLVNKTICINIGKFDKIFRDFNIHAHFMNVEEIK